MKPLAHPPTAAIADASIRESVPLRDVDLRPYPGAPLEPIAGRALAVRHAGSVDVFLEALSHAEIGDILVVDNQARDDEGCMADLTAIEAQGAGLQAAVIWGRHRDTAELARLKFPLYSLGACSFGPHRKSLGQAAIGEARSQKVRVKTGDHVFGDSDGVLFAPAGTADRLVKVAWEIVEKERGQARLASSGTTLRMQFGFAEFLKRRAKDPNYTFREHLRNAQKAIEV